jgi:23S rRNA pseudouridine2605 synthase
MARARSPSGPKGNSPARPGGTTRAPAPERVAASGSTTAAARPARTARAPRPPRPEQPAGSKRGTGAVRPKAPPRGAGPARLSPSVRGRRAPGADAAGHGLARILSKRGLCSRSQAEAWIRAGRVAIDGVVCSDPDRRTALDAAGISIDGAPVDDRVAPVYLMLNKPRGLVSTRSDERGRATVYQCLDDPALPWLAPVGRLDQASEGLLLFSNDSAWAARVAAPGAGLLKRYHVQIDRLADDALLAALRRGVDDAGEHLRAAGVAVLRQGTVGSWLQIDLDQGRNRQIRRMLAAHGVAVRRLLRVAVGPLQLGDLAKGRWRHLKAAEVVALAGG